ncbi:hypothetical protein DB806_18615, partial [Xanthomonas perforans]
MGGQLPAVEGETAPDANYDRSMTSLGISRRERPSHRHFPARTTLWFATMPPRLRAHPMEDDPIPP